MTIWGTGQVSDQEKDILMQQGWKWCQSCDRLFWVPEEGHICAANQRSTEKS